MNKTYSYTVTVDFDFEEIAGKYCLSKDSSFEDCEHAINDYVTELDDYQYYTIDNEDEIAQDLYDYLQDSWEDD